MLFYNFRVAKTTKKKITAQKKKKKKKKSCVLSSRLSVILNLAAEKIVMKCDPVFWSMTFRDVEQLFSFLLELASPRTAAGLPKMLAGLLSHFLKYFSFENKRDWFSHVVKV